MNKQPPKLNVEEVLSLFEPGGALSLSLKGFERRHDQEKMVANIVQAYNNSNIALIEAGTGIGKSLSYLIPAILWAHAFKEKTVISTQTIALQEQLLNKDIPLITKALNIDIKAVLVKGMSNYICLRKLAESKEDVLLHPPQEGKEIEQIDLWKDHTQDGTLSDIGFVPSTGTWERVCAESDTCSHKKCPFYEQCFFFKARKEAADAQILVANHHLLFADLSQRHKQQNYDRQSVLPLYQRIIIDEAHHIEDVATDYFANQISFFGLKRLINKLASEKNGKLRKLQEKLQEHYSKAPPPAFNEAAKSLSIDLPAKRNDLLNIIEDAVQHYFHFLSSIPNSFNEDASQESKQRILKNHMHQHEWHQAIIPGTKRLTVALNELTRAVSGLEKSLSNLKDEDLETKTKDIRFDISAYCSRISDQATILDSFISDELPQNKVRWIETKQQRTMKLINADLNISELLAECLFKHFPTIVLCSATLTTNGDFSFFRGRVGLKENLLPNIKIHESIYHSPFNYKERALFLTPTDIPEPNHSEFLKAASDQIWEAVQASRGSAFILFTSYSMLRECYDLLIDRLQQERFSVFRHGDANRQTLLNQFKTSQKAILFGTDSFWEGVDVAGDALRCVIIVKLPFKVPSEPIIQARLELIAQEGGDPFMDYSLPCAIVKFKQGVGRLIRHNQDHGCVVCLDSRLNRKKYGKQFLNSLPPFEQNLIVSQALSEKMSLFYRRKFLSKITV